MFQGYFNYSQIVAEGYWERHAFLRSWWRVYAGDSRWVPPPYPLLYRSVVRGQSAHLARLQPRFIRLEALQDTRRKTDSGLPRASAPLWETTVAAAVLLMDSRRQDRTAYLGMLHCVNDAESLRRFVGLALEQAAQSGAYRLVGPTGLSPHLSSGVLQDHFHVTPPLHTPYNPPYVPEVMQGALYSLRTRGLFHVDTERPPSMPDGAAPGGLHIERLDAVSDQQSWRSILVPLLARTFAGGAASARPSGASITFPAPDEAEAEFLLGWLSALPVHVWVAVLDDEPVGFVMLQPDLARAVARAKGGRNPLWRGWLRWSSLRPATAGRLLFGGVLPEYRKRGIGSRLWHHALTEANAAGWSELTVGPLPLSDPAAQFLQARGAQARQTYRLYTTEL